MIVRILSSGKSFKGLATYLTHDPEAKTADRVGWTHTHNLAQDHVPSAVDEMLWTARNAELLKQEAGIRAGGRTTDKTVKHVSLNWSPEDKPTREHMIQTAEGFLRHMNWHDHQALVVAHEDKAHPHVHVMVNMVHPENGLRLNDDFERRRAQAWALEYEREQGRIYCEQRLKDPREREDAMPRNAWTAFQDLQKDFERAEKSLRKQDPILINEKIDGNIANFKEWKILKQIQKDERLDFFAAGKSEFSELRKSVYREVREEFREKWSEFYDAKRNGADMSERKAELIEEQKAVLEARRDEACKELRETRNGLYRELLHEQSDIRHGLRSRQQAGFENSLFLEQVADRAAAKGDAFHETAKEISDRRDGRAWESPDLMGEGSERDASGMKSGVNIAGGLGEGVGMGLVSLLGVIADGIVGAPPPKRRPEAPRAPANPFQAAAEDARKQQQREREEADRDDWYRKQRTLSGE